MRTTRNKKIGIDGVPFFGNRSGIGQFAKRLVEEMATLESQLKLEIIRPILPYRQVGELPIKPSKHLSYRIVRWMPPVLYYQTYKRLGWAPPYDLVALRKYDAMLFFNFVSFPVRKSVPTLLFIHDLSHIHYPQFTSPRNLAWMNKFIPRSIKSANRILTISESSRQDIAKHYGVPLQDISIIFPAVNHTEYNPRPKQEIDAVKKKLGIKGPYILSVCTLEPRKNLIGVLQAFESLPEDIKQKYTLVLAGGKGWLGDELEKKYEELSKKYSILKTGYVDDADLPPLYSGAAVFVYPAFYEGFGMPPLEAMACGVPVITGDNSSLPEVVGKAAITLRADDIPALAENIEKVLGDKTLAKSLSQKGLVQAQKFSWEKSAKDLLEILDQVVGE